MLLARVKLVEPSAPGSVPQCYSLAAALHVGEGGTAHDESGKTQNRDPPASTDARSTRPSRVSMLVPKSD